MRNKLQPYKKLKSTEAIWLPQVPEHWELVKVRHLFKESTKKGFPNETLLVASQEHGVVSKDAYGKRTVEATKDLHNLKLVEQGDFVISLRSFQGGIEVAHERGIISPAYTIMKETRQIEKRYFKNLFKSPPFISLMTLCVKGIREGQNIDYPTFKNEYLPLPPIEEQQAIAAYLDKKNNEIDKFIRNKERLVELLIEGRDKQIWEILTGKKVANSKYKNSLIDCYGEIPESWDVKNLNYISNVVLGKMRCRDDKGNYKLKPYLKSKNVGWENVIVDDVEEMWFSKEEMKTYRIRRNDLLLSEGGEVGKTSIWNDELEECYIEKSVHKVTLKKGFNPIYYLYYFYLLGKSGYFKSISSQVSIGHLTREKLIKIKCIIPPPQIQNQLVEEIIEQIDKSNRIISKARQEISSIKEYREALITDLVTGRRSVPQ
jgi:type I restriction enzyme, S subunit